MINIFIFLVHGLKSRNWPMEEIIEEGMDIYPSNKNIMNTLFIHRGILKFEKNDFEDAVKDYTEALKVGEKACIFLYRDQCYCMVQLFDDATIDLLEVKRLAEHRECLEKQKNLERLVGKLTVFKTNKTLLEIQKSARGNSQAHVICLREKRELELKLTSAKNAFMILSEQKLKQKKLISTKSIHYWNYHRHFFAVHGRLFLSQVEVSKRSYAAVKSDLMFQF